jgi:hypothetical protein
MSTSGLRGLRDRHSSESLRETNNLAMKRSKVMEPMSDLRVRLGGAVGTSLMNPLSKIFRKIRRWIDARYDRGYDPY